MGLTAPEKSTILRVADPLGARWRRQARFSVPIASHQLLANSKQPQRYGLGTVFEAARRTSAQVSFSSASVRKFASSFRKDGKL
jgi:hypothetical protein